MRHRHRVPPTTLMYVYPWVLYDEGIEAGLDRLRSCGIDALQLAVTYHIASYLVPRDPRRRIWAGEQGALYFHPRTGDAAAWPVMPPVSALVHDAAYLPALLEAAVTRGFQVTAWVVYLYNHALARARPDLVVRNAFGDPNQAQLCPSNPSVERYALDVTAAATQLGPFDALVCESLSFLPYDYGLLNLKAAVRPGARSRLLLGLCFCGHCRAAAQDAGIAVDEFAAEVRQAVDDDLARLPDRAVVAPTGNDLSDEAFGGRLRAFLDMRARRGAALQRDVLAAAKAAGLAVGSTAVEAVDERVSGVPSRAVKPLLDELRIEVTDDMDSAAIGASVRSARAGAPERIPVYALYQLSGYDSEVAFVGAVERAREAGIRHFRFYEYGLLTHRQIEWLRGARDLWSHEGETEDPFGERGAR